MLIRWNSSYLLLYRLIEHRNIVQTIFSSPNNFNGLTEEQKKKLHQLTLKPDEWDMLINLRTVLEPFLESTSTLSGRKYPTLASCFIIWRLLQHFLYSTSNDKPVITALKESLRFRFNIYCKSKLPPGQLETMNVRFFYVINRCLSSLPKSVLFLILHCSEA